MSKRLTKPMLNAMASALNSALAGEFAGDFEGENRAHFERAATWVAAEKERREHRNAARTHEMRAAPIKP